MQAVEHSTEALGIAGACRALGVSRASFHRRRAPRKLLPVRQPSPRALSSAERGIVLEILGSPRFEDQAPAEVYATLLDEGSFHCSIRTMYRILASHGLVKERRNILRHPNYAKPELLATGPNQVWSWDITKLLGPAKWSYFYLYVIIDIFSRYVVGWLIADHESTDLAKRLIAQSAANNHINPGQLTIHADRGSSMRSLGVAQLLGHLGITKTHSRPYVSNDNPFSEAHFKIFKYRPDFPERFGCIEDAIAFCRTFFHWYNQLHHHSGLGLFTPHQVHHGLAPQMLEHRRAVLTAAFLAHPERFVRHHPVPLALPVAVYINPPTSIAIPDGTARFSTDDVASSGSPSDRNELRIPRKPKSSTAAPNTAAHSTGLL